MFSGVDIHKSINWISREQRRAEFRNTRGHTSERKATTIRTDSWVHL